MNRNTCLKKLERYRIDPQSICKKRIVICSLFLIVFISCIQQRSWEYKGNPVVMYVNNEAVIQKEYDFFRELARMEVYMYFARKYDFKDASNFWENSFNGESPKTRLKEITVHKIIENKVQKLMFKEYGIIEEIGFLEFEDLLKQENKRRKKIIEQGGVIYGPKQYTLSNYYSYVISNEKIKLKAMLLESIIPDSSVIHHQYTLLQDSLFKIPNSVDVRIVSIPFNDNKTYDKKTAHKLLSELKLNFGNFKEFEVKTNSLKDSSGLHVWDYVFDYQETRSNTERYGYMVPLISSLKTGEVSAILEYNDELFLAGCRNSKEAGYLPLRKVRTFIQNRIMDQWYEETINKKIKNAQVELR